MKTLTPALEVLQHSRHQCWKLCWQYRLKRAEFKNKPLTDQMVKLLSVYRTAITAAHGIYKIDLRRYHRNK